MATFSRRAGYAREAIALTLAGGIVIHTIALFMDRERFVREVFTPSVDRVLTTFMTFGLVMAIVHRRRFDLGTLPARVGFGVLVAYLLVSVPLHVRASVIGSTEFALAFPSWYSLLILPVQAVFLVLVARLRLLPRSTDPSARA